MADSKCASCGNTSFELKEAKIEHCKFRFNFIQCASCGAVIGLIDYNHVPTLLNQIIAKLAIMR